MSNTIIQPYLFFAGRCEEALQFYKKAIDAKILHLMRFSENPEPMPPGMLPEGYANKIMHCSLQVGETLLMCSDGCGEKDAFAGFSLSITVPTEAEAERVFAALAEGGQVRMPLSKTFWSPRFGMVADRFGMGWMITVPHPA